MPNSYKDIWPAVIPLKWMHKNSIVEYTLSLFGLVVGLSTSLHTTYEKFLCSCYFSALLVIVTLRISGKAVISQDTASLVVHWKKLKRVAKLFATW